MKVELKTGGIAYSRIIAGVMKWGVWGADMKGAAVEEIINHCLENEVTTFDHADIYGHYTTEELFGKILKTSPHLRDQMQIITKCGINLVTPNRPEYKIKSYNTSKDHILNSVEKSLENLQTDYIDLLLIHRPSPLMNPNEIAEAFSQLRKSGKVREFGVSNFTTSQFELLNHFFPLCTNQVEASLTCIAPFEDGTFDQSLKYGCKPMAWSPLGGGAIFGNQASGNSESIRIKSNNLQEKYNAGMDQILLAWLLKHPANILPVLGTTKTNRISDAIKSLEIDLSDEEWFALLEASKGKEVA